MKKNNNILNLKTLETLFLKKCVVGYELRKISKGQRRCVGDKGQNCYLYFDIYHKGMFLVSKWVWV